MTDNAVHTWQPESLDKEGISLSEAAIKHVHAWMKKESAAVALRLAVRENKGCSGFMYHVELADAIDTIDHVFPCDDIKVLVDPESLAFLKGSQVDYVQEGLNWHFKFKNPNESASCGCGESFSV